MEKHIFIKNYLNVLRGINETTDLIESGLSEYTSFDELIRTSSDNRVKSVELTIIDRTLIYIYDSLVNIHSLESIELYKQIQLDLTNLAIKINKEK